MYHSISTRSYEFWSAGKMHNYLIIKPSYTDQKKLLPNFLKFKLNKRGVSFLGECITKKGHLSLTLRLGFSLLSHSGGSCVFDYSLPFTLSPFLLKNEMFSQRVRNEPQTKWGPVGYLLAGVQLARGSTDWKSRSRGYYWKKYPSTKHVFHIYMKIKMFFFVKMQCIKYLYSIPCGIL